MSPTTPKLSSTAANIPKGVFAELEAKIAERTSRGGDIIGLHIGDTHIAAPSTDIGEMDAGALRYGVTSGIASLKEVIAARVKRERSVPFVTAERIHLGVGGTHALYCAARATLDPGDEVIVLSPYWPLAPGVFTAAGAVPVEVPLTQALYAGGAPQLRATLEGARTKKTRGIYFISPNNPDGKIFSHTELLEIAQFSEQHNLWVYADEVYADFSFAQPHVSFGALSGVEERTILVYSFSKSHAIAGARVGYVVAPLAVIQQMARVGVHTVFNVPVAMQRVAEAALAAEAEWVPRTREAYRSARALTSKMLTGTGVAFFEPDGGTYHFIDFKPVLAGRPLRALLEKAIENGVLLTPGQAFGDYPTSARLCFTAVSEPKLKEGIERLLAAVKSL